MKVYIKDKQGTDESVWVGGVTAKELKKRNIPYVAKQDWGNWMFSIPRTALKQLQEED